MREIKFRAWNGDAMEYGGFSVHASSGQIIAAPFITRVTKDAPLMQFTGLHDKNGKEIYEGDRLIRADKNEVYEVRWDDKSAGFVMVSDGDKKWLKADYQDLYEVIGNIYEHPQLLE